MSGQRGVVAQVEAAFADEKNKRCVTRWRAGLFGFGKCSSTMPPMLTGPTRIGGSEKGREDAIPKKSGGERIRAPGKKMIPSTAPQ
jgi:hypothetical protein